MNAEEYVKQQVEKNQEYYKTPNRMIDEQIELLQNLKVAEYTLDEKWRMITAVSEAWHIFVWVNKKEQANRLIKTIASFIGV